MNFNSMKRFSKVIAALLGACIWILSPAITGRSEPWDSSGPYYWAALFVAGLIVGLIEPEKFLRTSLWVVAGQALAIVGGVLFEGKDIGLLIPMGLIALLLLSAPCYAGAFVGARIRHTRRSG